MSARIKVGLIAGGIGLVLTVCVSAVMGICGPGVSLVAGALAGYFTVKQENPASQSEGGKAGAISGAIAGALGIIGQIIGGVLTLAVLPSIMESMGNYNYSGYGDQAVYWLSGAGTAFCFGIVGVILAAIAGYATGYISSNKPSAPAEPQQ
jgi:hypothetical protein